ncbi:hypothetical protein GCM10027169_20720 [Gordonia jinhuaensis]|uniref:DUF2752 domain-containing protein n=1 Tax=Gordonia jinhuaensis TaxID=1517702 RepID=A0A916X0G9_9ACTN|nr:hypothetical protein GCM10011489_34030 [Gordonia jinhuaensis]
MVISPVAGVILALVSVQRELVAGGQIRRGPGTGTLAAVAVVTSAMIVAAAVSPAQAAHGPVLCPFRLATGLPCPGCGLTRSWVALAHGDVAGAFALNLFGPPTMVLAVAWLVSTVASRGRAGAVLTAAWNSSPRVRRRAMIALAVVVVLWLGYGAARIADALVGWGVFVPVG